LSCCTALAHRMETTLVTPVSRPAPGAGFPSKAAAICILIGVWLLIYMPALTQPGLLDDADSIHAEAAREMVLNHNWVTLYINGIRYLEKAPLMYWSVAASYKL